MRTSKLIGLAALSVGMSAQAQVGPGPIGSLDNTAQVLVSLHPVDLTGFLDSFIFTVSGTAVGAGVIIPLAAIAAASPDVTAVDLAAFLANIATIGGVALIDAGANVLAQDTNGADGFSVAALLPTAGTYAFVVAGQGGTGSGLYLGLAAAQLVPEPATYALALLGLGVVGWAARRRQS